jgi:hypothetical protein
MSIFSHRAPAHITQAGLPEAELATLARHQPTYRVERLLDAPTGSRFVIMVPFIFGRA